MLDPSRFFISKVSAALRVTVFAYVCTSSSELSAEQNFRSLVVMSGCRLGVISFSLTRETSVSTYACRANSNVPAICSINVRWDPLLQVGLSYLQGA